MEKKDLVKILANIYNGVQDFSGFGLTKKEINSINLYGNSCMVHCIKTQDWDISKLDEKRGDKNETNNSNIDVNNFNKCSGSF